MIKHINKKEKIVVIVLTALFILLIGICIYTYSSKKTEDTKISESPKKWAGSVQRTDNEDIAKYINDVNYSGIKEVPWEMYAVDFDLYEEKGTDYYIPNKELSYAKTDYEELFNMSSNVTDLLFNKGYQYISENQEEHKLLLDEAVSPFFKFITDGYSYDKDYPGWYENLVENLLNSKTSIEAKLESDDSLVFECGRETVIRCELDFTIYECSDVEILRKMLDYWFFEGDYELGKTYSYIVDFGYFETELVDIIVQAKIM